MVEARICPAFQSEIRPEMRIQLLAEVGTLPQIYLHSRHKAMLEDPRFKCWRLQKILREILAARTTPSLPRAQSSGAVAFLVERPGLHLSANKPQNCVDGVISFNRAKTASIPLRVRPVTLAPRWHTRQAYCLKVQLPNRRSPKLLSSLRGGPA